MVLLDFWNRCGGWERDEGGGKKERKKEREALRGFQEGDGKSEWKSHKLFSYLDLLHPLVSLYDA